MRGIVQADILKEDQGQNTCIFSTEFSLKIEATYLTAEDSPLESVDEFDRAASTPR